MSMQMTSTFFDEPTPLLTPVKPRRVSRAKSSMTCPECGLQQSVSLDCAGCGRIMKPSVDFRLADPLLAPSPTGLESMEPVEAVGHSLGSEPDLGGKADFKLYVDEEQGEGAPWVKMVISLLLCWLAWDLNARLLVLESTGRVGADLPLWLELTHSFGREGSVMGIVFVAAILMIVSARQVLSGS